MKILKLIGIFGGGFVVGGIAVGLWSGYLFSRMTVPKEVDVAFQAAQQAEWLAELRLDETTNAIKSMENSMDIGVVAISQWAAVRPPDEKTRKARDGFLSKVKVYHESYPITGDEASSVNALLATVPGRSPQSTCKAGICRLDDRRLATLNTKTNSP
jgi:hypothetical protein